MTDLLQHFYEMADKKRLEKMMKDRHGWEDGKFNIFRTLPIDNKGDIGEDFIVWLLEQTGRKAICTRRTDPTMKHWDIKVEDDNITLEVKTATLGYNSLTFQHEGFEPNRNCDGIVLLDIAPDNIYISCICKWTMQWKKTHHRRTGIQHKHDTKLRELKEEGHEISTIDDFERHYNAMVEAVHAYKIKRAGKPE